MSDFPPALPHGELEKVFDDIYVVKGAIVMNSVFRFSRNMTVIRHDGELTLINSVRLDEAGLAALAELGEVKHVMKLGFFHGRDDAFYVKTYGARMWAMSKHRHEGEIETTDILAHGGELPFPNAELIALETAKKQEALLRLDRDGGILVACDAFQNWHEPDRFFNGFSKLMMRFMGFIKPANIGPAWLKFTETKASDFRALLERDFDHVLPAHGDPIVGGAKAAYTQTVDRIFGAA